LIGHLERDVGANRGAAEFLRLEQVEQVGVPQVPDGLLRDAPVPGRRERPLAQNRDQLGGTLAQAVEGV
jgi:hypothetical protein